MMTLPRTVADVLSDHVTFEVECIDRMYLNVWVPRLAYGGGVAGFFVGHRGNRYASTALMDPMSKAFVADIHDFIATRGLELVGFAKGQRKDELTQQFLAGFPAAEGVLYVGRAQEKSGVWRTQRRHNPATGGSYAWLVRATAFINFFYFYCVDADFGPFFIKFSTYFPFTAKICINGNEWAKRQAAKAGIGFEALDNGFAAVDDVDRLQAICDSLGPGHIEALLRKWLKICPTRSPPPMRRPATGTSCRSCRPSSPSPRCSTDRCPGESSSSRCCTRTSTLAAPTRLAWSSTGASSARATTRPRAASAPGSSPTASSRPCTSTTRTPRSSSTTRKGGRCGPRPRSTTPATSDYPNG